MPHDVIALGALTRFESRQRVNRAWLAEDPGGVSPVFTDLKTV